MSYIDAIWDRKKDIINVVERDPVKGRIFTTHQAKYLFYYPDERGKYNSIFGEKLNKITAKTYKDFQKEQRIYSNFKLYESDINPIFRCFEENYLGKEPPPLNICFFDIEVDFDPERGYASPDDPFMPITSISLYLQWMECLVTLAVPPKTLTIDQAKDLVKDFPNTFIFETEAELLDTFLDLIQDADIISGWNSEGFDIPFTVNRVTRVLSKEDTRRFCLWNEFPKKREFEKYGKTSTTYDFVGRVHLDSLILYRKYTYEEHQSFSLDSISYHELKERKTPYEGTLDQLYNNDFKKFIEYNRQDVSLLNKLDRKLKFIDLANSIAHENTVLLQTVLGAVAVTEQAIINEAHYRGLIVPSRSKNNSDDTQAVGAYVATPKKGLHDWIGLVDINSLYPSVIRALNMGPETIVGQLRQDYTTNEIEQRMAKETASTSYAVAWDGKFGSNEYEFVMKKDIVNEIIVDWENGETSLMSGAEIYKLVFESNKPWILSANGTIFTYETEGVIPGLLKKWYNERKELQAKLKEAKDSGNSKDEEYWDKRQLVKKINLNSLYGAILNAGCRFFDKRIGQSTTLSGRQIVKHMNSKINEIITGDYDHTGKSVIYSDTDSCYFSAYSTLKTDIDNNKIKWNKDSVIQIYDTIAKEVNSTFPNFMLDAFHCPASRGEVIKAGRELIAIKGLFITKKRYAVIYYDKDGKRYDIDDKPGKIKAMGLDLKRSDTPEYIQDFLSDILEQVLLSSSQEVVIDMIKNFRTEFRNRPGWEKGTPRRVNNMTSYFLKEESLGKADLPGHVRASINWNTLKRLNNDKHSLNITDGSKIIVCKIKNNPLDYTSVAYPIDQLRLPEWFKNLPFDHDEMESSIFDKKLENLIGILNWPIKETQNKNVFNNIFEFV
jgi:DNA polymerase elongation subunit (family B)